MVGNPLGIQNRKKTRMKKIFYNEPENRLRTGWRILIFLAIFWVFSLIIFAIKPLLGDMTKREFVSDFSLIIVAILSLSATIATLIARKYLDKKSFVSLGLNINRRAMHDLIFGFILSGLMAGLFFILMLIFGLIEFNGLNIGTPFIGDEGASEFVKFMSVISFGSMFLLFIEHVLVGYWEELAFRGYLFQNMTEGMGLKLAIVISCLIYGLVHAMNPNAGLLSSSIIVLFGFLRLYGYISTKMLWLSIGMHIGWNFFQGPIFGFAASGHKKAALINISITGKEWLSGGEFGPEGSVIIIPIILLALYIMKLWSARS